MNAPAGTSGRWWLFLGASVGVVLGACEGTFGSTAPLGTPATVWWGAAFDGVVGLALGGLVGVLRRGSGPSARTAGLAAVLAVVSALGAWAAAPRQTVETPTTVPGPIVPDVLWVVPHGLRASDVAVHDAYAPLRDQAVTFHRVGLTDTRPDRAVVDLVRGNPAAEGHDVVEVAAWAGFATVGAFATRATRAGTASMGFERLDTSAGPLPLGLPDVVRPLMVGALLEAVSGPGDSATAKAALGRLREAVAPNRPVFAVVEIGAGEGPVELAARLAEVVDDARAHAEARGRRLVFGITPGSGRPDPDQAPGGPAEGVVAGLLAHPDGLFAGQSLTSQLSSFRLGPMIYAQAVGPFPGVFGVPVIGPRRLAVALSHRAPTAPAADAPAGPHPCLVRAVMWRDDPMGTTFVADGEVLSVVRQQEYAWVRDADGRTVALYDERLDPGWSDDLVASDAVTCENLSAAERVERMREAWSRHDVFVEAALAEEYASLPVFGRFDPPPPGYPDPYPEAVASGAP